MMSLPPLIPRGTRTPSRYYLQFRYAVIIGRCNMAYRFISKNVYLIDSRIGEILPTQSMIQLYWMPIAIVVPTPTRCLTIMISYHISNTTDRSK